VSAERKIGPPRGWRLIQQAGITKQFQGEPLTVVFSNPGEVQAVRFRGKLYKKEGEILVLFSDEELQKMKKD
jgi:hypothetical protein